MDDLHRVGSTSPVEQSASKSTPYTIDQAIGDALDTLDGLHATIDIGAESARVESSDPHAGDSGIEYWIWTGTRLVRASQEESERLRQVEVLDQEELRRLRGRQRLYRLQRWQSCKRFLSRLAAAFHSWVRFH